jgi:hypothetical protein
MFAKIIALACLLIWFCSCSYPKQHFEINEELLKVEVNSFLDSAFSSGLYEGPHIILNIVRDSIDAYKVAMINALPSDCNNYYGKSKRKHLTIYLYSTFVDINPLISFLERDTCIHQGDEMSYTKSYYVHEYYFVNGELHSFH